MDVASRPTRVCQILLADENKRCRRHIAVDNCPFVCHNLVEGSTDVNCSGALRNFGSPRNSAFNGKVNLERSRAVSK